MKRILLTSLEFGTSFGVDRAICDLIIAGRLSAVGCVVTGDLWQKEFYQLRDVVSWAEQNTKVGVTIRLSKGAAPLTPMGESAFGAQFPSKLWYYMRAPLNLLPDEILEAEIAAQIELFQQIYLRAPAFIALDEDLMAFSAVAQRVLNVASLMKVPKPALVGPAGDHDKNSRFHRAAKKAGLETIFSGPTVPVDGDETDLREFFWHGLDVPFDHSMVFCQPAYSENKGDKKAIKDENARERQLRFLSSEEFPYLLNEKDIFLF
ncbi:ChbG/HpnK family deacetylase [Pseudovibrio exalbescens]|uniref:ChbG/HpnK family deacetylase n=1 Tax=Pseudovibrio exalbescens TaxID=197461 RepID=UPI0023667167|nr:ChbG/HpnK family deacetylase [Pseudovibrio exalbescens]MDD7911364.1 ChbG/HpnK family deacetylase [Pseudovibrio exalbescens]